MVGMSDVSGENGVPGADLRLKLGLMSEDDLARALDVKVTTLQDWRQRKIGPDYVKLGKGTFYRRQDVEDWIAANVVATKRVG